MTNDGTNTLTYDANGNMVNDGVNAHTWDRANRLLSMGGISYAYNGDGNRIQQDALQYILDLQPGLAQVIGDSDGNRYIHSPRGIHASQSPISTWSYIMQDGLGSVRSIADSNGSIVSTHNYTPIGVMDVPFEWAFTGEQRDSTGVQYHRARYYSPNIGIFPSLDPWEGVPLNAMSLNRYGYVWGNPVNRADASGLCPQMMIEQTRSAVRTLQALHPTFMSIDGATADTVAGIVCAAHNARQYAPQVVAIGGTSVSVGVAIAGTGATATAGVVLSVASLGLLLGVGIYLGIRYAPAPYTPDQLDDLRPPTPPSPTPTGTPVPYMQPQPTPAPQPQPVPIPALAPSPGDVRIDPRPNDPCKDDMPCNNPPFNDAVKCENLRDYNYDAFVATMTRIADLHNTNIAMLVAYSQTDGRISTQNVLSRNVRGDVAEDGPCNRYEYPLFAGRHWNVWANQSAFDRRQRPQDIQPIKAIGKCRCCDDSSGVATLLDRFNVIERRRRGL